MAMFGFVTRSIGRKLFVAVGLPLFLFALAGVLWLRHLAGTESPGLEAAFRVVILGLVGFGLLIGVVHLLAVRILVELPLQRLAGVLRQAQAGDFLHRIEVDGRDELAGLARSLNTTLAAITDLHAMRIEDLA
jgi:methyl-accepting chemotaxis protein